MLYSQLIHLGDSETESSDETSDLCYSSIRPLDSDNSNNVSNIYETLDSYNKAYLTYLQPLSTADQFMIHPYQSSLFKSPLISDVQLGFDHDSALQQTVMDQQKESYSWLYHDPVDAFIANQQPELTSTYVSLSVSFLLVCLASLTSVLGREFACGKDRFTEIFHRISLQRTSSRLLPAGLLDPPFLSRQ